MLRAWTWGIVCLATALVGNTTCEPPNPPAFPGAEGHGASSLGGRRGAVIFVDSLADSGPGTLRAALEATGPRTVIFRVGGTITLKSPLLITNPFVTVAGQTAPGGGIQLRNDPVAPYGLGSDSFSSLVIETHDVVVRYLRIRPGPLQRNPACTGPNAVSHPQGFATCVDANDIRAIELEAEARRVMLDHLSLAWATDKALAVIGKEVSLQWSILAEGLNFVLYEDFFGTRANNHGHGTITGHDASATAGVVTGQLAFHHNLFALLVDRAPQMNVNCPSPNYPLQCASDVVNNWVYGWGDYGASISNVLGHGYVNVVGNYFREGRDTISLSEMLLVSDWGRSSWAVLPDAALRVHLSRNRRWVSGDTTTAAEVNCTRWNEAVGRFDYCDPASYATARHPTPPITTTVAKLARTQILADAGASQRLDWAGVWRPARDAADARVLADATNGSGRIIEAYDDFPGWPTLANGPVPVDTDQDGMPNAFEDSQCLDATHSDANFDADADGYTNLEEFLNGTPAC